MELEDTREEVIQLLSAPSDEHEPSCATTSTENAADEAENEQNDNDNVEDDQLSATSNCLLSSLQVSDKHMPLNINLIFQHNLTGCIYCLHSKSPEKETQGILGTHAKWEC